MAVELKIPPVGESITEVTIGEWLKEKGEWVAQDEPVVVIETDKVNMEVPAPVSGIITEILLNAGDEAQVGDLLGHMEEKAESDAPKAEAAAEPAAAEASADAGDGARISPAARAVMQEHGVSPGAVTGSGPSGRVTKEDVLRHVEQSKKAPKAAAAAPAAPAAPSGPRATERVPMTPLRRTVASRLVEAQQNAALLTTFNEVDMSEIMGLRKTHQEAFVATNGIKLGFMSFFVKAVVDALKAFPAVNAQIDGNEIVYHNYCDIGVAVGGGKGLVVPVIRNAERLSFAQVEGTIRDFGARAKSGKLKLDELMGGTFTITNGGVYGSLLSTPIINPPQSGILGMHGIQERPVAVNGEVVIRPMMYIALTYDHRIVDGREAVSFLKRVKECCESPVRMLLEV
ncbi:MAG: 2-oxoglutarate dehydrogenase complex dihydrolipoyllysine-residue succinyltransferase [Bradymonadia bacterium]